MISFVSTVSISSDDYLRQRGGNGEAIKQAINQQYIYDWESLTLVPGVRPSNCLGLTQVL